ncbi:MAG TPA: hypothetical protein VK789_12060, partial [Bryobacteraceae bacterium]|nr:hypothetical protein [Bryobacteraceae bacterium]
MIQRGDGFGFTLEAFGKLGRQRPLMATSRFRRGSRTLQTSPMPPLPMGESNWYRPRVSPGFRSMGCVETLQPT